MTGSPNIFAVCLFGLMTASCAGSAPTGEPVGGLFTPQDIPATKPVIPTAEARKIVLTERARLWKDPESIRDAKIGESYACKDIQLVRGGRSINAPASCICVELNARNSYGGYTGLKRSIAVFPESGEIIALEGGTAGFEERCQQLKSFPELNGRPGR